MRIFHGTICVQVRVGGKPLWFVMDSGAAYSTVDPAAVRGLVEAVPLADEMRYGPGRGLLRAARLDVGGATLLGQTFFAASAPYPPAPGERPTDRIVGLLGYNALRLLTVGIDFQNRRLWAWRPEQSKEGRAYFFGAGAWRCAPCASASSACRPSPAVWAAFPPGRWSTRAPGRWGCRKRTRAG